MNPCPCGYLGDELERCRCTPPMIDRYRARISGPLLDRIDIRVTVARQTAEELMPAQAAADTVHGLQGEAPRLQVCAARQRQWLRAGCLNARLPPARLASDCVIDLAARALLQRSQQSLKLTGRGLHRLLRLARTIADLESSDTLGCTHVAEAISLRRPLD
jgi:magnesium chelatase family protein